MKDLARLALTPQRHVLGNKDNVLRAAPAPAPAAAPKKQTPAEPEVVVLEGDENAEPLGQKAAVTRLPKATALYQLTRRVPDAIDNVALARVVRDFWDVLQSSRSRTLTKEGFAFLDALHKQLADPSVFVAPARTSRPRASGASEGQEGSGRETRQGKMNKLFRLGVDARAAGSNEQLARLVSEFGQVIFRSTGRTVTKDGLAFLNVVAARLEVLS